jgi:hypothetical protein
VNAVMNTIFFSILLHCVQWVLQVMLPSACSFNVLSLSYITCFGLHDDLQVCRIFFTFIFLKKFASLFFLARGYTLYVSISVFLFCFSSLILLFLACICLLSFSLLFVCLFVCFCGNEPPRLHKILGNYGVVSQLVASDIVLSSVELTPPYLRLAMYLCNYCLSACVGAPQKRQDLNFQK